MSVAHGEDNRDDIEKFTLTTKAFSSKRLVGSLDKKGAKGPRGWCGHAKGSEFPGKMQENTHTTASRTTSQRKESPGESYYVLLARLFWNESGCSRIRFHSRGRKRDTSGSPSRYPRNGQSLFIRRGATRVGPVTTVAFLERKALRSRDSASVCIYIYIYIYTYVSWRTPFPG